MNLISIKIMKQKITTENDTNQISISDRFNRGRF